MTRTIIYRQYSIPVLTAREVLLTITLATKLVLKSINLYILKYSKTHSVLRCLVSNWQSCWTGLDSISFIQKKYLDEARAPSKLSFSHLWAEIMRRSQLRILRSYQEIKFNDNCNLAKLQLGQFDYSILPLWNHTQTS